LWDFFFHPEEESLPNSLDKWLLSEEGANLLLIPWPEQVDEALGFHSIFASLMGR
jgi:hypothetical protein